MRLLWLVGLTVLFPLASGSGTLEAGPIVMIVQNGQPSDCEADPTQLCLVSSSEDDPRNTRLNATQHLTYVGLGVNRSFVNEQTGFELLPGGDLMLTPSGYAVPHPVFDILIEHVGTKRGPAPLDGFGIAANDSGVRYFVYTPDRNMSWEERDAWPYYDDGTEPEHGWIRRHEIRFYVDLGGGSTDQIEQDWTTAACRWEGVKECVAALDEANEAYRSSTPDVHFGLALVEVEASTDPDTMQATSALGTRSSPSSPLGPRTTLAAPRGLPEEVGSPRPLAHGRPPPAGPPEGGLATTTVRPGGPEVSITDALPPAAAPPRLPLPVVYAVGLAIALFLAALYARIRDREAILSGYRARMLEIVKERGPCSLSELATALRLDRSTVKYHARLLAKVQWASLQRVGRNLVVALPGHRRIEAPKRPSTRDVLLAIIHAHDGEIAREELQRIAGGVPLRTQNHALKQLRAEGVVETVIGAGKPALRLTQRGNSAPAAT